MPQISAGDVKDILQSFGIQADESIMNAFNGLDTIDARQLLGSYATARKAESDRQANDPLNSYIKMAGDYTTKYANMAETMHGQLQDLLSSAPKLFGEFTPDQVSQYLAPLQQEFQKAQAVTEGAYGRRGIAGSSTEAQALQIGNSDFQKNVLQQGLSIGVDSQQKKAAAMQARIAQLQGASGQAFGLEGNATATKSAQDLSQSNLLASLPFFLSSADKANAAAFQARQKPHGFLQSLSDVATGTSLIADIGSAGATNAFGGGYKGYGHQSTGYGSPTGSDAAFPQGSQSPTGAPLYQDNSGMSQAGKSTLFSGLLSLI